jgi:hypothetical protein
MSVTENNCSSRGNEYSNKIYRLAFAIPSFNCTPQRRGGSLLQDNVGRRHRYFHGSTTIASVCALLCQGGLLC